MELKLLMVGGVELRAGVETKRMWRFMPSLLMDSAITPDSPDLPLT